MCSRHPSPSLLLVSQGPSGNFLPAVTTHTVEEQAQVEALMAQVRPCVGRWGWGDGMKRRLWRRCGSRLPAAPLNAPAFCMRAFLQGAHNRTVGCTQANERSSRSHSLLMVDIAGQNLISGVRTLGRLVLVDLA